MKKRTAPRIIAGKLKGRRLKSLPGNITRPITDRVKENLFNIIGTDLYGCSFLDAFGGTGSVGIEAYSRGAEYVQLLELNLKPYLILKENVSAAKAEGAISVLKADALKYLRSNSERSYDYIFIAPPQYHGIWKEALQAIDQNASILSKDGEIIVQIDPKEFQEIKLSHFIEASRRVYGNTLLLFISAANS